MSYDQPYTGVRTPHYKYVEWGYGAKELYDLRKDPYEMHNLVADPAYAQVRDKLARKLAQLRDCKGASCQVSP
jgi:arylsulfatase A-like enzyme